MKTIKELSILSNKADISKPSISEWSAGMHIHHCCLVIIEIYRFLRESSIPPPSGKFSIMKMFVFITGFIPRGKGTAPDRVLPEKKISSEKLYATIDEAEKILDLIKGMEKEKWFNHHVFGILSRDETIQFIKIHNRHHLKIIRDIVA